MTVCMYTLFFGTLLCILIELPSNVALRELFESTPEKKPIGNGDAGTNVPNGKSQLNATSD